MNWSELSKAVRIAARGGDCDPAIVDVVYDSRTVTPGAVYVAIPGTKMHGDSFIADAVAKGASVVVSQNPQPACGVAWVQVSDPRVALGELARALWHVRIYDTTMVGVTGTNGKTTIAHMFRTLLSELRGADNVWCLTTVANYLGLSRLDASHTTPESADLFRLMGAAPSQPSTVVMEVSSHALELDRVAGLSYDCAIWTNLTQDHLDFHKTMGDYYQAKKRLFTNYLKSKGKAVINLDDTWGSRLSRELTDVQQVTYGTSHGAKVRIANWKCSWDGTQMDIITGGEIVHFRSKLVGQFNVYNMAALVAGAVALGIDLARVQRMLEAFEPVVGRMERIPTATEFSVVVDYAHTPDALENVLRTAADLTTGRVLCVFGCGGDRDRTKRPRMASAVAHLADEAIITSDNPRSEDPMAIIEEVLEGIPLDFPYMVVADRRMAIARALDLARAGDCVLIAGKGHETYQEIKGVKHHFSDREVVEDLLQHREPAHV